MIEWAGHFEGQRRNAEKCLPRSLSAGPYDNPCEVDPTGAFIKPYPPRKGFRAFAALRAFNGKRNETESRIFPNHIAMTVGRGHRVVEREWRLKEIEVATHDPESAPEISCEDLTGNPALVVDAVQLGVGQIAGVQERGVNRSKGAAL